MKKGFTLIELLTVMLIMGLMGTAAVGGYRAMQRGMEERGVIQNANALIRAAYQRAQIDRQPTAVYFWNETLRAATEDEHEVVVGKAIAVRRYGRITGVEGTRLFDEFADLDRTYSVGTPEDNTSTMYLYPMGKLSDIQSTSSLPRSLVNTMVTEYDLSKEKLASEPNAKISAFAYNLVSANGVQWKTGTPYGLEFQTLELPDGYIFGTSYSSEAGSSVQGAGTLVFQPSSQAGGKGGTSGRSSITVSSLRPRGASLEAVKVGDTDSPEEDL